MPKAQKLGKKAKRPRKNRWSGKCLLCAGNHFHHRTKHRVRVNTVGDGFAHFPPYPQKSEEGDLMKYSRTKSVHQAKIAHKSMEGPTSPGMRRDVGHKPALGMMRRKPMGKMTPAKPHKPMKRGGMA